VAMAWDCILTIFFYLAKTTKPAEEKKSIIIFLLSGNEQELVDVQVAVA